MTIAAHGPADREPGAFAEFVIDSPPVTVPTAVAGLGGKL
jgi:hypothetical protein